MYVDLNSYIWKCFFMSQLLERGATKAVRTKRHLYRVISKMFGFYQASGMEASKWQAMSHIFDGIKNVASIEFLHAGCFKSSHKSSKKVYRRTLGKVRTAMNGTLKEKSFKPTEETIFRKAQIVRREIPAVWNMWWMIQQCWCVVKIRFHWIWFKKDIGFNLVWKKEELTRDAFRLIFCLLMVYQKMDGKHFLILFMNITSAVHVEDIADTWNCFN